MLYIIGQGCYSDWSLVGYTDNKELAADYVARHNEKEERSWDKYWFDALDKIESEVTKKRYIEYTYRCGVNDCGEYEFLSPQWEIGENEIKDEYSAPRVQKDNKGRYAIFAQLDAAYDDEKVMKIMRDALAEYKAREEGLC